MGVPFIQKAIVIAVPNVNAPTVILLEAPLNPAPWVIIPLAAEYVMSVSVPLLVPNASLLFPSNL
jgi:hypothetical protein